MFKLGFERDGLYYYKRQKRADGSYYEYWVTREKFLSLMGADYFDRPRLRAEKKERKRMEAEARSRAYAEQKLKWAETREERKEAARVRKLARLAKKRKENREHFRNLQNAYYERHKTSEAFRNRTREAAKRWYKKHKLPGILERKAKKEAEKRERLEREAQEREARRLEREERKAQKEREKLLRKPRVVLTDEERKERRRQEKRNYKHRRRVRLKGLVGKATAGQIRAAKAKAKGVCFYCRSKGNDLTIDHIVPIAKGGNHTLDNIVFACHACNSEKRDLEPHEFAQKFGKLLV